MDRADFQIAGLGSRLEVNEMHAARTASFEIVDRLSACLDQDAIIAELARAGDTFGFESFFVSGLPSPRERIDSYVLLSGWPEAWFNRYVENDYVHADPVCRKSFSTSMPFKWEEAYYDIDDHRAHSVMTEAPAFGLVEGFAVPIFTLHGLQALMTFGSTRLDISDVSRAGLHLVAIYAHNALRALRERGNRRRPTRLSPREEECLKWAAAGKSTWETSVVLSLSEHTVKMHLARAASKLNAVNRVQAVAEALRQRLIA